MTTSNEKGKAVGVSDGEHTKKSPTTAPTQLTRWPGKAETNMILDCPPSALKTLPRIPSDPDASEQFDAALQIVHAKYVVGEALTRKELLKLAQAALALTTEGSVR